MIIISVGGGLGNQMFEYAFYYKVRKQYPDTEVKLDLFNTLGYSHNGYEIEKIFGLKAEECTLKELKRVSDICPAQARFYKWRKFAEKVRHKFFGVKSSCIMQKDATLYEDKFFKLDVSKSYYLFGIFANYRFFNDIAEEIQDIYSFPMIADERNKLWESRINSTESVGIHIRRGDYIEWGIDLAPDTFYREAMSIIEGKLLNREIHYFVFTDDPDYVKERFGDVANLQVIEGNEGIQSYIDMQLMSLCKHNIIANSTFSFWGAFLNKNADKIVVAPNLPYTGCKCPFVCEDWITIEV